MSKTPFRISLYILSVFLLLACNNDSTIQIKEIKDTKESLSQFKEDEDQTDVTFYELVDPKGLPLDSDTKNGDESKSHSDELNSDLPPDVLEAIKKNREIELKKQQALEDVKVAKRIEAEILQER